MAPRSPRTVVRDQLADTVRGLRQLAEHVERADQVDWRRIEHGMEAWARQLHRIRLYARRRKLAAEQGTTALRIRAEERPMTIGMVTLAELAEAMTEKGKPINVATLRWQCANQRGQLHGKASKVANTWLVPQEIADQFAADWQPWKRAA